MKFVIPFSCRIRWLVRCGKCRFFQWCLGKSLECFCRRKPPEVVVEPLHNGESEPPRTARGWGENWWRKACVMRSGRVALRRLDEPSSYFFPWRKKVCFAVRKKVGKQIRKVGSDSLILLFLELFYFSVKKIIM